jgi:tetratricopeptide (TPR) repeat protein
MRLRFLFSIVLSFVFVVASYCQINTDRVMLMGRNALYYEDYVLAIQRFNAVIDTKPYLADPYFYRGLAKFYLEDYAGGVSDCSLALDRKPYTSQYYTLRGLCRINMQQYALAIADYRASLQQNPTEKNNWHNMVLCMMELKLFDEANQALDTMMYFWPRESSQCTMKAQVFLAKQDTLIAEEWVDSALVLNKYDGGAWGMKAAMFAKREQFKDAEMALDMAIMQKPRVPILYVNRALARYQQNNIRGAMADYDQAIEIDASSYVAHYNRGLLRAQVGDNNRAIEDFDFVLSLDSTDMVALYNRAILLDMVGDYKGAIRDISLVLDVYPQFWVGYRQRAAILRKIGDVYGAERDEFRVLKAEMEVRTGTYKVQSSTRKKSEQRIEDYNKLVVDEEQDNATHYASEFRGRVQNKQTELRCMPEYVLAFYAKPHPTRRYMPYSKNVDDFSKANKLEPSLVLSCGDFSLDSIQINNHQQRISADIVIGATCQLVMDYYLVRDFESAMSVLDSVIVSDKKTSPLYLFLRAQVRTAQIEAQPINESEMRLRYFEILQDYKLCSKNLADFPYSLYNTGNIYVKLKDYASAVNAYTEAIKYDARMPEAFFNRGVAYILSGKYSLGLADLSKAGEMGLYQAYNLIKRYSKEQDKESKK